MSSSIISKCHDDARQIKWSKKTAPRADNFEYVDPGIDFLDSPSLTDQSQSAECDINLIMKRYIKAGMMPVRDQSALFQDVSSAPDYRRSLDIVMQAEDQFMSLDAETRKRFDNDPGAFLDFFTKPENTEEAIKLGLGHLKPQSDTDRLVEAIKASKEAPADTSKK